MENIPCEIVETVLLEGVPSTDGDVFIELIVYKSRSRVRKLYNALTKQLIDAHSWGI